ncbi:glutamate synthase subunit beta [Williamsia sp. CHRR-6]|uniref:glutamate synthase subunit beta n=1 Tax=Williamsia sp. CHRR-6 TaxID=2835871 RepID=UPI001BDB24C2|nr:glutamate synthase subunit beta [Williamsia sp. CHRR-6]MBT0565200.1 glutamate synthase subunit beta [Williamsia sp. CHRR-6]
MADPRGFLEVSRRDEIARPPAQRVGDWRDVYVDRDLRELRIEVATQARRCMDCGIPFCHSGSAGCPLGNLIPEWNDLVRRDRWEAASARLHATNNFPEFTGKICPAPCESACVLSIAESDTGGAVTIKRIEKTIAEMSWDAGHIKPEVAAHQSGKSVAVVGSGPAGLAAAQQLTRAGHQVTVYERDDRLGGLLRYGIPEYKLQKSDIDRRIGQMQDEGTRFRTGCEVGVDVTVAQLRDAHDAVVLALGALDARDNPVPGRDLAGIHLAMEHLVAANRECEGDGPSTITAAGKHVVIIGGGDTGADCLGTAHRQGAASVTQLDYNPALPTERDDALSPWPTWPLVMRSSSSHDEGGQRRHQVAVQRFRGDSTGQVSHLVLAEVEVVRADDGGRSIRPVGPEFEIPCDMALFAIGFEGVEPSTLLDDLGLTRGSRGTIGCSADWHTDAEGVFVCGDAHRGASLVVWAIAEGRSAARGVDEYLMGSSDLPAPVHPAARPLSPR